jgi:GGDEF domain-containing protein
LRALECTALGFDHVALSAKLLDNWGLPHAMVNAIRVSHDAHQIQRLPNESMALAQILHLAELTSCLLTRSDSSVQLQQLLDTSRQYRRQISKTEVEDLVAKLSDNVAPFAEALALSLTFQDDYQHVLQKAYAQLTDAAEQAAGQLIQENSAQLQRYQLEFSNAFQTVRSDGADSERAVADSSAADSSAAGSVDKDAAARSNCESTLRSVTLGAGSRKFIPLAGPLSKAMISCNQSRRPFSLALLQFDNYERVVATLGREATIGLTGRMGEVIHRLVDGEAVCFPTSERRFAMLLEDCDRQDAVRWLRHLSSDLNDWLQEKAHLLRTTVTVSIGLASMAVPPKNFPCEDLIEAAERCLSGAQLQGGDALKSIDL